MYSSTLVSSERLGFVFADRLLREPQSWCAWLGDEYREVEGDDWRKDGDASLLSPLSRRRIGEGEIERTPDTSFEMNLLIVPLLFLSCPKCLYGQFDHSSDCRRQRLDGLHCIERFPSKF